MLADSKIGTDPYILARTEAETARLRAQSRALEPVTLRTLERAGLARGMRCLDVGCGTGDVMRLMAHAVGPGGCVTGYDIDAALGARTLASLKADGDGSFAFVAGDITANRPIDGAPFDLVFARLLLCHMTDPVEAVRHLAAQLRPGGRLVLVDYDMSRMAVRPEQSDFERGFEIVTECFRRSGKDADAGLRLGAYMVAAGLPPAQGYDAQVLIGIVAQVGPMLDGVLASLAPAAAAYGVAAASEVEALRGARQPVIAAGVHTALGPLVVGTWTARPD